jgi:endonuclease/exonuclease/phosphatase family metal-dependent hydrolase
LQVDVVALQEVWTSQARAILIEAARASGLTHVWHRPQAIGGSGLMVLSRWPFREVTFESYLLHGPPHLTQLDYLGGKGFVRLRIESPEGHFALFNTHLQARYGRRVDHGYAGHRAGQIVQLAQAMRATDEPVLLLGDFNMREDHTGYAVLRGLTGARDLSREFGRAEATVLPENPYRNHDNPRRVDYVFARDGRVFHWEPRSVGRAFDADFRLDGEAATYSNHAGVFAEVALAAGEGAFARPVDPRAVLGARAALRAGRESVALRRGNHRASAAAALAGAALLAASLRSPKLSRRRFLRSSLQGGALALTAPAAALAAVSEFAVPGELAAFDALDRRLARFETADPRFDTPAERSSG